MESMDLLFSKVKDLQFTQQHMQVKLAVNSKSVYRWRRNQYIMVKQLGTIKQAVAKLSLSPSVRASGDGVPDAPQRFVEMSQEVTADQMFMEIPLEHIWDEERELTDEHGTIWDEHVEFSDLNGAPHEIVDTIPLADVIWEDLGVFDLPMFDGMLADVAVHDGLLKQLAQGRNCFVDVESSPTVELITAQDTTNISEPHISGTHFSALQHGSGEKVNQDLVEVRASIQPVEHVLSEDQALEGFPFVNGWSSGKDGEEGEDLLQQLAHGGDCLVGVEIELTAELVETQPTDHIPGSNGATTFNVSSSILYPNNAQSIGVKSLQLPGWVNYFPSYFEECVTVAVYNHVGDIASPVHEYLPRKCVPIGPEHQAEIPEWRPRVSVSVTGGSSFWADLGCILFLLHNLFPYAMILGVPSGSGIVSFQYHPA